MGGSNKMYTLYKQNRIAFIVIVQNKININVYYNTEKFP